MELFFLLVPRGQQVANSKNQNSECEEKTGIKNKKYMWRQ